MEKYQEGNGGAGTLGMLAILFIGLKLTGHIDWSWWVVLSPLWGGVIFLVALIVVVVCYKEKLRRRKPY